MVVAISKICANPDCQKPATRSIVYRGSVSVSWWCDSCDPYQQGAFPGKLVEIRNRTDAYMYVMACCNGRKGDLKVLMQRLGL